MSTNVRMLNCSPEEVFRVLADGWLFPGWVVGASRMRAVDEEWPATGSRLQHSFGVWPALIDDETVIEHVERPRQIVLRAKGWPMGEARVVIDVKPRGNHSIVRIQEEAVSGPAAFIPRILMDLLLHWRNAETLHRLAFLAEGLATAGGSGETAVSEGAKDRDSG
ncbi:SRPBCC family protein [Microbacterium hominis]|uniref:SRPBCC family protein n=1 Tax=Microbacterium hominis TaxID=162426 RepID=UPI00168AA766|nr:SRPBCC family protein [Microbacterium hominis]QOC25156.1 SRPBCC family protein [Microbacterium hominis]QOC29191.1 SRPBCC family protein [Microbacterium hominis]